MHRNALAFAFVASLIVHSAQAQQSVYLSDTFDFGIDEWIASPAPGNEIVWQADDGDPAPGSLAVRAPTTPPPPPLPEATLYEAWGPCYEANPGEEWRIRGQVQRVTQGAIRCYVAMVSFTEEGCGGSRSLIGNPPSPVIGEWFEEDRGLLLGSSSRSVRPALSLSLTPGSETPECRFDSVVVTGPVRSVLEVPSLSPMGLATLCSALAFFGILCMRRFAARNGEQRAGIGLCVLLLTLPFVPTSARAGAEEWLEPLPRVPDSIAIQRGDPAAPTAPKSISLPLVPATSRPSEAGRTVYVQPMPRRRTTCAPRRRRRIPSSMRREPPSPRLLSVGSRAWSCRRILRFSHPYSAGAQKRSNGSCDKPLAISARPVGIPTSAGGCRKQIRRSR